MTQTTFSRSLREHLDGRDTALADLGQVVPDTALVETAAYVLQKEAHAGD
jgi:hypothetical protein